MEDQNKPVEQVEEEEAKPMEAEEQKDESKKRKARPPLRRMNTMLMAVEEAKHFLSNSHFWTAPTYEETEETEEAEEEEEQPKTKKRKTEKEKKDKKEKEAKPKTKKSPAKAKAQKAKPKPKPKLVRKASITIPSQPTQQVDFGYKFGGRLALDRLTEEERAAISKLTADDLIIVQGGADHTNKVVDSIGIPYKFVAGTQIDSMTLNPKQVIYVNCTCSFTPTGVAKIKEFVEAGGLLVTTDHALSNVVEAAFPGLVTRGGSCSGSNETFSVNIENFDKVISGFVDEDVSPEWTIAGGSYSIKVLDKEKVKVLLSSPDLQKKYEYDPVLINFSYGKGKVYHMISHFYLQRTSFRQHVSTMTASDYAKRKRASEQLILDIQKEEKGGLRMEAIQTATTSVEFLLRSLLDHILPA